MRRTSRHVRLSLPVMLAGIVLSGIFLWLAGQKLDRPGPYYDEWIHVPVALKVLGECDLDAAVSYTRGCFPLMQQPPYVGPIKAWLTAPVFAVFGVDAWTVRVPPILLTVAVMLVFFQFCAKRLGVIPGIILLALMATDPVLVVHTRFDWGPFVISNACKLLFFVALWRWLESGRLRDLALAAVLCLLGFVDKLNFVWIIVAFGAGFLVLPGNVLWDRIRHAGTLQHVIVLGWVAGLVWIGFNLVLPAMATALPSRDDGFTYRVLQMVRFYNLTFSGLGVFDWMFPRGPPPRHWPIIVLCVQNLLAWWALWRGSRDGAEQSSARALLAFSTAFVPVMLTMIVMTRQAGGFHHSVLLIPFQWLQLVSLVVVVARDESLARWARRAATTAGMGLLAALLLNNMQVNSYYQSAWNGDFGYRPYFDPALYDLAKFAGGMPVDGVVSTQWGLHHGMLSLAGREQRPRYRDWWGIFVESPESDPARTRWLFETKLDGRLMAFVSFHPHAGIPPSSNLASYLAAWPHCNVGLWIVNDASGAPLFEVVLYRFGKAGC